MVTSQTISNCWRKTGILPPNNEIEDMLDDDLILDEYVLIIKHKYQMQMVFNKYFFF